MSLQSYAVAVVVFIVFLFFSYVSNLNHALTASRAKERDTALKFSNYEALHDSTHEMARENSRVALIIGDSVRAFGKRVVQQVPARDKLDSALDRSPVATYQFGATVRQLDAVIATLEAEKQQSGERPFRLRQEPFTVDAVVSQPPAGDSMSLAIHVALDTIPLGLRIQCSGAKEGIREASIVLKAPPWASVRVGAVEQDPGICNRPAHEQSDHPRRLITWAPVALSVGRQIGPGAKGWSAQIGTAITLGRR